VRGSLPAGFSSRFRSRSFPTILPNGRVTFTNVTLRDAILIAYRIDLSLARFTVVSVGGESSISGRKFDISAVPSDNPGAGREQSLVMLRTLLAERFGLRVHTEMRELPVYALTVARLDGRLGPQFRSPSHDCAAFQVGRSEGRLTQADDIDSVNDLPTPN
jgi:uncharacterized protein (TIGR03435 family)